MQILVTFYNFQKKKLMFYNIKLMKNLQLLQQFIKVQYKWIKELHQFLKTDISQKFHSKEILLYFMTNNLFAYT